MILPLLLLHKMTVIFRHGVHLKLGHRFHALLKVCSDREDIVPLICQAVSYHHQFNLLVIVKYRCIEINIYQYSVHCFYDLIQYTPTSGALQTTQWKNVFCRVEVIVCVHTSREYKIIIIKRFSTGDNLKGQYRHDQSRLSGHGIGVLA